MARRRRGQAIELDERAKDITDVAVFCRNNGHGRVPVPAPAALKAKYAPTAVPKLLRCPDCGYTRGKIIDLDTWNVVGRVTPKYPDGYLFKDGRGRWTQRDARREHYARTGQL